MEVQTLRQAVQSRFFISFVLAAAVGMTLFFRWPFPADNAVLQLIQIRRHTLFESLKWTYTVMLFTTPYISFSVLLSLAYIFVMKQERKTRVAKLPPYPALAERENLFVVI